MPRKRLHVLCRRLIRGAPSSAYLTENGGPVAAPGRPANRRNPMSTKALSGRLAISDGERVAAQQLDGLKSQSGRLACALFAPGGCSCLDALSALYGLSCAPSCALVRPCPRRCEEQQHRGRVEQQRNHENEPSEDRLVVGADERRQNTAPAPDRPRRCDARPPQRPSRLSSQRGPSPRL